MAKKASASRQARTKQRRARKATARVERRPVFEQWATMAPPDKFSQGRPRVCLWGTQKDAEYGVDNDEQVVLVRVEVLEVLDEE